MNEKNESILFGKIDSRMPIEVKGTIYNHKRYLDVRKMYINENQELKPTSKGITLNYDDAVDVIQILKEKEEDIIKFLEKGE